jgi:hypothetical protein
VEGEEGGWDCSISGGSNCVIQVDPSDTHTLYSYAEFCNTINKFQRAEVKFSSYLFHTFLVLLKCSFLFLSIILFVLSNVQEYYLKSLLCNVGHTFCAKRYVVFLEKHGLPTEQFSPFLVVQKAKGK